MLMDAYGVIHAVLAYTASPEKALEPGYKFQPFPPRNLFSSPDDPTVESKKERHDGMKPEKRHGMMDLCENAISMKIA